MTLAFILLVNLTTTNISLVPVFEGRVSNKILPVEVWHPVPIDTDFRYFLAYAHQAVGVTLIGFAAVGVTLLVIGYMYQVCAQYHILSYRFYVLPQIVERFRSLNIDKDRIQQFEKNALKQNVQHHLYLFRLAKTVNDTFKSVILQQFCLSAIVVSATIYQLSTKPEVNMELVMLVCYLTCILTEFLIYCYFGNEIMIESMNFQNTIYSIDWSTLSISSAKSLMLIMLRSSRPITMYCGHFIVLSLESYIGILKVSYSVFNILRRS